MAATLAWRLSATNGSSLATTDLEKNGNLKIQDSEPPTPILWTLASVAQCIEQLRQSSTSVQEKEYALRQLRELVETRENAFSAVGSHSQAVPVLVSLLRSGSLGVKIQAATVLGSLCKENELRVKVLLGGCIPPLLGLLKSSSEEGQIAAAKTIYAVSQGGAKDHVGSKIFSTEGVCKLVDNLLTGALKNLSSSTEGFWSATIQAGGVDILVKLLTTGQSDTQANVCFLLACMMMEDESICSKVLAAEATKELLKLLGLAMKPLLEQKLQGPLSLFLRSAKLQGKRYMPSITGACDVCLGKYFWWLVLCHLKPWSKLESCSSPAQTADTLGALASALMIYDSKAESTRASEPDVIEQTLVNQFKPHLPFLVQERTIEALASLYGNAILSIKLTNSEAKRLLVGLITMAINEVQDELVRALLALCNNEGSLWRSLQGREGVQLLISLLGLSSEQQQECAVALLCLLSNENDESKWASLLLTGSAKAKEDSATILRNLCNHSEDIRACVESADAVPALLWLLKNGSLNGKEIAAKTLNHLIHKSDTATISQLTALLTSDLPESKVYVLDALRSMLSVVHLSDMLREGSAANDAIETMIKILSSTEEETQAKSASALAGIFETRKDLLMKLLNVESEYILAESSHCLASLFLSIKENRDVAAVAPNSSTLEVAEQATCALANLILDGAVSEKAIPDEIIVPATRILHEGTISGKTHAAAAIARLLHSRRIDNSITDCVNHAGTVLALVSFLESASGRSGATSEALAALAILSRSEGASGHIKPAWADKAIEILSRLCRDQPFVLGNAVASASGCITSVARRVIDSTSPKVKIGGAALLVCAAKVSHQIVVEDLNQSNSCNHLIQSLVTMLCSADTSPSGTWHAKGESGESHKGTAVICDYNLAKSKIVIMEAGAVEVLADRISSCYLQYSQSDFSEDSSIWICALLLATLFQDRDIIRAHATMKSIPALANLLKSEESANKYFAAQAIASLVCNGSRGTLLSVANSGAAGGLISLLGCADGDISDLLELSEEFALVRYPDQVALERLFRVEDIRVGATLAKQYLLLSIYSNQFQIQNCPPNKTVMVESGILEALTKYLSLGLQDATEEAATDLLGILFSSAEIRRHEAAFGAVSQLVAVLRLGGRAARYSAAKALESLFSADHIRMQTLPDKLGCPLQDPLVKLLNGAEGGCCGVVWCFVWKHKNRSTMAAARCVEPLYSVVCALDKLVDEEQLAELVAAHGAVIPLVGLLYGGNFMLHEAISEHLALFLLLTRPEFGPGGQHSALQVLVNILEHPQCRADYNLTSHQTIEPLIPLLDSQAPVVQQLAAELLSICSWKNIFRRIQAVKALVSIALIWPIEIAKEGGVSELSKVILQADPSIPHACGNLLLLFWLAFYSFSSEFYLEMPVAVLVRLLRSGLESTVIGALNALLVLESDDGTSAELWLKVVHRGSFGTSQKPSVSPNQAQQARLLATLALGDLFQNEGLARSTILFQLAVL
ncbi:protein CELLULOSE SYNTHASE INTERACTIVE [Salix suchowensis]|nr:protein CELLULOSE SYNTHASE INTERACTIVE [Salix suchowensis]